MAVQLKNKKLPLGPGRILELLNKHSVLLPKSLHRFYETCDGGLLPSNTLRVDKARTDIEALKIYGVNEALEVQEQMGRVFGKELLPISSLEGGNWICVGLSGDKADRIYYWDHELGLDDGKSQLDIDLFELAYDIFAFFDKLQPFDPSSIKLAPGQLKEAWIDPDFLKSLKPKDK